MKVLVPVDGSPASIRAIKLAIDQVKVVAAARAVSLFFDSVGIPKEGEQCES